MKLTLSSSDLALWMCLLGILLGLFALRTKVASSASVALNAGIALILTGHWLSGTFSRFWKRFRLADVGQFARPILTIPAASALSRSMATGGCILVGAGLLVHALR